MFFPHLLLAHLSESFCVFIVFNHVYSVFWFNILYSLYNLIIIVGFYNIFPVCYESTVLPKSVVNINWELHTQPWCIE